MANPLVFGLKLPQKTPPKPIFSLNFVKTLGTPLGNWNFAKKRLVFGLKFSKTSEKSWKKGPFLANPGISGPLTAYLGSRGPICLVNTLNHQLFLALAMICIFYLIVAGKGSQRWRPSWSHCTQGKIARICYEISPPLACQYPQPPALLGPSYVFLLSFGFDSERVTTLKTFRSHCTQGKIAQKEPKNRP